MLCAATTAPWGRERWPSRTAGGMWLITLQWNAFGRRSRALAERKYREAAAKPPEAVKVPLFSAARERVEGGVRLHAPPLFPVRRCRGGLGGSLAAPGWRARAGRPLDRVRSVAGFLVGGSTR